MPTNLIDDSDKENNHFIRYNQCVVIITNVIEVHYHHHNVIQLNHHHPARTGCGGYSMDNFAKRLRLSQNGYLHTIPLGFEWLV
jgi:hypothetical protein